MAKSIFSKIKEIQSNWTGSWLLAICGVLLLAFIWSSIYFRLGEMYAGVLRDSQSRATLASHNMASRIVDAQKTWNVQAGKLIAVGRYTVVSQQSIPVLAYMLESMYVNNGEGGLYDKTGKLVASSKQLRGTQQHLDSFDLGQLSTLGTEGAKLLTDAASPAGRPQSFRYVTAIPFLNGTHYLVSSVSASQLLSAEWLSSISPDVSVVVHLKQGGEITVDSLENTARSPFIQASYSRWIRKLPDSVSASHVITESSVVQSVEVRAYAEALFQEFEYRTKATILLGVGVTILLILASAVCHQLFRKVNEKQKALSTLVSVDALTGLPNRRSLNTQLDQIYCDSTERVSDFGLLFVDLDNFKPVNDTYGHKMGDLLLQAVAGRLRAATGPTETICRLGGDEFAIVTRSGRGHGEMQRIARAVVACFAEPFVLEGIQIHTAASVGLAFAKDCRNSSELLKKADMAMYDAKNAGKGKYREFSAEMAEKALEAEQLTMALKSALAGNQFRLVYQPKVSTFRGNVVGFEALLRWRHPTLGEVSPCQFIPLAEANGAIHELGTWVLNTAVGQLRQWYDAGQGWCVIAVNVSAVQLLDPFFVGKVKRLLDTSQVPPSSVQIELTESVLASNVAHAKKVLNQLRNLGLKLAIDDFGTGYSSLNSLQQFDIDYLKVDQSFVRGMGTSSGNKICRSIVSLAHSLGMAVIAEGVETVEQFSALYEMGCDELQGYLLARPMPPEEAIAFRPERQGLWADIDRTREELNAVLPSNLEEPITGLQLLELELQKVHTGFGDIG
jgi:diguanylate cyclase (GGDEF)-like protein